MSKDLNKEYYDMIEADAPDLWDRINASLPEKKTEKKKKTKIYRFGMLAAACVCIAVIIPAALMNIKGKGSASSGAFETAEAIDEETVESMEIAAAEETAAEMKTSGYAENAAPAAAAAEEADETAEDAVYSEAEAPAEGTAYSMDREAFEEVFLTDVKIRINEELTDGSSEGMFLADVLTSSGPLTQGDIIIVSADEDSPEEFAEGIKPGTYICSLRKMEEENGDIVYILR